MYLNRRFYLVCTLIIALFGAGYIWGFLFFLGRVALLLLLADLLFEVWMLYRTRQGIVASRHCRERFSNGDQNPVRICVENQYPFPVRLKVIDEIPFIFQERHIGFLLTLAAGEGKNLTYELRPTRRGVYGFGQVRVFARMGAGLLIRRYTCAEPVNVKVYPSYLMLHRFELLAMSNRLTEFGIKKIRRIGHQTEFEQIKEYVQGDDFRTINWKASARRHDLMVNLYQDERSQQIYNVIDKGRVMQQAFQGMTLLDYSINASLMLSYIAIHKSDKAGLATFNQHFDSFVPASRQTSQMELLLENLYKQETTFGESDFSALCVYLKKRIARRSLLILYTNFDSMNALNRQIGYLAQLSKQHRLLVVFFEDNELREFIEKPVTTTEGYYQQVIAEKFTYEKRLIVSTLMQHGIYSVLTTPDQLTVDVVNKYLEMKSRQLI